MRERLSDGVHPGHKPVMSRILATWLAGLIVLLPLALTVALLWWVVGLLNRFVGPDTLIGRGLAWFGYPVTQNDGIAYVIGTLVLFVGIYVLGLAVQAGLKRPLARLLDRVFRDIPVFGKLYGFAEKLVGLLDNKPNDELKAMGAVWCFFGGEGGVAVLALAPSADPIEIDGKEYFGVMVPTAPVPIGGALLYVPMGWVKPANIGMDKLTAVYVSMGLTPPKAEQPAPQDQKGVVRR